MSEYTETERFTVTDDKTAEWCLQRIKEAEAERDMWKKHYEEQMSKVNENVDSIITTMTAYLEEYFETVPHKATKTQESYALPHAKLVRKHQQPQYTVDDEAVVKWLEDNGMHEYVKVKKAADWANLKKQCAITPDGTNVVNVDGEIIDGITVTQRPDVFKVEMEA